MSAIEETCLNSLPMRSKSGEIGVERWQEVEERVVLRSVFYKGENLDRELKRALVKGEERDTESDVKRKRKRIEEGGGIRKEKRFRRVRRCNSGWMVFGNESKGVMIVLDDNPDKRGGVL